MAAVPPNPRNIGRHEWNRYEDYKRVHERKLADCPFLDEDSIDITFEEIEDAQGAVFVHIYGWIYCPKGVTLEIEKFLATERRGRGRGNLYVRGLSYRYNAWIEGKHTILRYDNNHDLDDYHGHWYDPQSGQLTSRRSMARDDFPLLSEVLEELDSIIGFSD